jgi:hypothetical protein
MTTPAGEEIPVAAGLGIGDVYVVRSGHGAVPYLVACLSYGEWVCSCPADHKPLRAKGAFCRPIREAIALRSVRLPSRPCIPERQDGAA